MPRPRSPQPRTVEAVHRSRFLGRRARLTFTGQQLWIAYHSRKDPVHLSRSQIRRVQLAPPTLGTRLWFLNQVVLGVLRVELVDGEPMEFLLQSREANLAANRGVLELGAPHAIDGRLRLPKGTPLDDSAVKTASGATPEVPAVLEPWMVWVDHRGAPDEVVEDLEAVLRTGSLRLELDEGEPPRATLHHAGVRAEVPLREEPGDLDRLFVTLRELLGPAFDLRIWSPSARDDTIGVLAARAETWSELAESAEGRAALAGTRPLEPGERIFGGDAADRT